MSEDRKSIDPLSDVALMRRVAQGEESAVTALYDSHADPLFRFVYRRTQEQREDAEDITHDTFLSAVRLARSYDGSCAIFTWLCGVAKVRIIDFYRRQGRAKRIPPAKLVSHEEEPARAGPNSEPGLTSFVDQMIDRLDAANLADVMLQGLADEEQEVLRLRYLDGLSVREIAALMKRSEKAIEHMLARARKKAAAAGMACIRERDDEVGAASQSDRG